MAKETFNYEQSLKKLEKIVDQLEDENTPLEKAIELFTEGKKLAGLCLKKLTELEQKVQLLMENEKGETKEQPFSEEDESFTETNEP